MQSSRIILLSLILFSFKYTFAQDAPDSRMYMHSSAFWSAKKIIFVKGDHAAEFGNAINSYFDSRSKDNRVFIKQEKDLDSADLNQHLFFFGPLRSFTNLNKFLPEAFRTTGKGFTLQDISFNDSLDAVSVYSSDTLRFFQLGNSMSAIITLWTTPSDISQYLIMQGYAVTHHGYLNNDSYSSADHFDVVKERENQLKKYSTKYYNFFYADEIFSHANKDSLFNAEDAKLMRAVKILQLKLPTRKIDCYVYKDIAQKYYLSATPGYGNPFIGAWQNHSIGLGPVEHESIHILCGNQLGLFMTTFWSEGIVGYYYYNVDSLIWKKDRQIISDFSASQVKNLITGNFPGFSSSFYAISGHVVKFLVDTYGLDKFKKITMYDDVEKGFQEIYNKSIDTIAAEWKNYAEVNKVVLGPERQITFKVICPTMPDTSYVYITGSNASLANWEPGKVKLDKQKDGSWSKTFNFGEGLLFNYKITRGSWNSERLDGNGKVPGDSFYEVKRDDTVVINISKWKDSK